MNTPEQLKMEEHAEQTAIGFAEWIGENSWQYFSEYKEWRRFNGRYSNSRPIYIIKTTKELYEQYLNSLKAK